jgi:hypothetical protein
MKIRILLSFTVIPICVMQTTWALTYVVKPRDVLSKIAHRYLQGRIYGKHGSLSQVLKLNSKLRPHPNLIYPGQEIEIPLIQQMQSALPEETSVPSPQVVLDAQNQPDLPKMAAQSEQLEKENYGNEFEIGLQAGYGLRLIHFNQSGAFGGILGFPIATNLFKVAANSRMGLWRTDVEYSRLSLNLNTDTSNPTATINKAFQDLNLLAGYSVFNFGLHANALPIMGTPSTTSLSWTDLTTLWAVGGIHLEKNAVTRSSRQPYRLSVDANLEYALASGGGSGFTTSSLQGYGARVRARAQKGFFKKNSPQVFLGVEAEVAAQYLNFLGTSNTLNGIVIQRQQSVQALVTLEIAL